MAGRETGWNLESFVDSLIVELDNTQNTLAVKGLSRPLTYTVQNLALDLHVFPDYDGKQVRFRTAKAGENGASKITLQLGSITDRQIRETTRGPLTREEMPLDAIDELDEDTKKTLKSIGVSSVRDLEKMEKRNVDLPAAAKKRIDYGALAKVIQKAKRRDVPPRLERARMATEHGVRALVLEGENLLIERDAGALPFATVNGRAARVIDASERRLSLALDAVPLAPLNRVRVALDPHAILTVSVRA